MPERPEAEPIPSHVDAVIEQVLRPQLATLAQELRHPLHVLVHVLKDGTSVQPSVAVESSEASGPLHIGEARLRFRPTHFPERRLFFLDAVFTPHPSTPAFSGFFVRGRIDDLPSGPRPSSARGRSNVMTRRGAPGFDPSPRSLPQPLSTVARGRVISVLGTVPNPACSGLAALRTARR